jgi:hypothetical protein
MAKTFQCLSMFRKWPLLDDELQIPIESMKAKTNIFLAVLAFASFQVSGQNLVQNGSFATGDFTDWSLMNNNDLYVVTLGTTVPSYTTTTFGSSPPESTYYATLGPDSPPVGMSQTIGTTPGDYYTFSFYISHPSYESITSSNAEFTASFAGYSVYNSVAAAITNWTLESFTLEANAVNEAVTFTSESDSGYYQVGDISVIDDGPAPPALSIQATDNNGVIISWPTSATGYVLEQESMLGTTNWVSNTNTISLVNGTNQLTMSPATNQMFFQLINTNLVSVETLGEQLRRLASNAATLNPVIASPLIPPQPWARDTYYSVGVIVSNAGSWYMCVTNGTSASVGGPVLTTGAPISDSGAGWLFEGVPQISATNVYAPYLTNTSDSPAYPPGLSTGYAWPDYSHFFYSGGSPRTNAGTGPYSVQFPAVTLQSGGNFNSTNSSTTWSTMFDSDSADLAIGLEQSVIYQIVVNTGGSYQLIIPGAFIYTNTGGGLWQEINWSNSENGNVRQWRHYLVMGRTAAQFGPGFAGKPLVAVATGDSIVQPGTDDLIPVVWFGNSYMSGGNGFPVLPADDIPHRTGFGLGWYNIWNLGEGGTDYSNNDANASYNYLGHMNDMTNGGIPKVIVFAGGLNDNIYVNTTSNSYVSVVLSTFQKARSLAPNAWIVVTGVMHGSSDYAAITNTEIAIHRAFQQWNDPNSAWIPIMTDPQGDWITGTGDINSPVGNGNADFYISGDGVHPCQMGEWYLAQKLITAIKNREESVP